MTDSRKQPGAEAREADTQAGLTAYRLAWTRDEPSWQLTADLEPVPEAETF